MAEKLTLQDYYKYNKSDVMHKGDRCRVITINVICASNCTESMYLNPIGKSYYIPLAIVSDCKLILRHIPQLTDAEKIYINDNLFYELFKNTVSLNANAVWNSLDELLAVCGDKTALIDYLRGNNILIEPEDWFKSGKAVKK